jgi:DNA-binding response OmpR family regulator
LCESYGWACAECETVRSFRKLIQHTRVSVTLTRHRLADGYSDDVIAALSNASPQPSTRIVVLLSSGTAPAIEARQIKIGADCALRDPIRVEVLIEYLAKYRQRAETLVRTEKPRKETSFLFAGARVDRVDRQILHGKRAARLTPREIDLLEVLAESDGEVASYHDLFSEILGRSFRGDTSNLRVLLGLLDASMRRAGIELRRWVEVIPKLGYRYCSSARTEPPIRSSQAKRPRRSAG